MTLHEVPHLIRQLVGEYNEFDTTDERREEIERQISALELTAEDRCEYYATVMAEELGDAEVLDVEIKRLTVRKKRHEATAERFKLMIDTYLQQSNIAKLKTKLFTFSYRTSKIVKLIEGANLDKIYLRFKEPEPDKVAIKAALENGKDVPGASIEIKFNLQIK